MSKTNFAFLRQKNKRVKEQKELKELKELKVSYKKLKLKRLNKRQKMLILLPILNFGIYFWTLVIIKIDHYILVDLVNKATINKYCQSYIIMYLSFGEKSLLITKQSQTNTSLEISYQGFQVKQSKASLSKNMIRFNTLIGLKCIKQYAIIFIDSEINKVTSIGLSTINEIKRIRWIAVAPQNQQQQILKQLAEQLQQIQEVFAYGLHYYSQLYDLSLPYVYNKIKSPTFYCRQYYDQFIWNLNLANMDGIQQKAKAKVFMKYCNRIIQGYIEEYITILPNYQKIRYILISRRSSKKAGTRFYARGIDDEGNVANFVQTEQIIDLDSLVFTHLQIRGSVPAFFAQTGINGLAGQMVIQRTGPLTLGSFRKHFSMLNQVYKRIFSVNLLSEKKSDQKQLSNFYEELVHQTTTDIPYLRYQFYDFHEECKGDKFENSEKLIDKLNEVLEIFGFNCYDTVKQKFLKEQSGIFRTNCLDCLDRTNYIQSRLALRIFKKILIQFGGKETEQLTSNKQLLDLPVNQKYPLLSGFNSLWADNGDSISLLYTGICSTHTDITRTGQRTFFGSVNHKFRSLMRFYTQFTDHKKQNAINRLTIPTSPQKNNFNLHDFHSTLAVSLQPNQDKEDIMKSVKQYLVKERPTLIVYFVFESKQSDWLDKLKCYFNSESTSIKSWISALDQFSQENNYTLIGDLKNQYCWLSVFCKKQATQRISQIKKQNLSNNISSGEALLIKMKLQTSSFIFAGVNCSSLSEYLKVFDQLHEKGFQTSKLGLFKSTSLFDLDYRVIMGNTGSKFKIPENKIQDLKRQLQYSRQNKDEKKATDIICQVLDSDEMNLEQLRYRNKYIRQYSQGPINFIPNSNRLFFWNEEGVILRVRDYKQIGQGGLNALLDYEIGRGAKSRQ